MPRTRSLTSIDEAEPNNRLELLIDRLAISMWVVCVLPRPYSSCKVSTCPQKEVVRADGCNDLQRTMFYGRVSFLLEQSALQCRSSHIIYHLLFLFRAALVRSEKSNIMAAVRH